MVSKSPHVVNATEMSKLREWIDLHLLSDKTKWPFSFNYEGCSSDDLIKTWKTDRETKDLDELRTQHHFAFTEPDTGLQLRCVAVEYHDFPSVEWTLYFKNTGSLDTLTLSDIQALDIDINLSLGEVQDDDGFILHHFAGGYSGADAYRPYQTVLGRENDSEDRQGITEIGHVTGCLTYWDELARRHPDMVIDCCAGGGQRNDLETLRRAVPLWRSDYQYEPIGVQCQTYGISFWLPYYGGGNLADANVTYHGDGHTEVDSYAFWSACFPSISCGIDMRVRDIDYAALRRLYGQVREIVPHFYGDFYPLTPYSLGDDVWLAWQFNNPESGDGMVQAFRREKSVYESARFCLRGLESEAHYSIANIDGSGVNKETGQELMEAGLLVSLSERPQAAVITYKKTAESSANR